MSSKLITSKYRHLLSKCLRHGGGANASSSSPCSLKTESMFERLNWDQLAQGDSIVENLKRREERANVERLRQLWQQLQTQPETRLELERELVKEAIRLPNYTHKASIDCGAKPKVIKTSGTPLTTNNLKELHQLCESNNFLWKSNLGDIVGSRPYILQGFLAELEQALINFTVDSLRAEGFQFISVPDLLYAPVIEACGFPVKSERNMVYEIETLEGEEPIYLSGTSEMGIAGYLANKIFSKSELPLKLAAVSRCFRAETSRIEEEKGIYRVHNFSKVEMFALTESDTEKESEDFHDYLCQLQEKLFSQLGLHYQVLEMPPNELGSPAYRKYDIEAWMPGRKQFGEISSCSNCIDYQARRLNIRYLDTSNNLKFASTLNGTACAIPRMLIALVETHQDDNGNVPLPSVLDKYMYSKWDSVNLSKNVRRHSLFMKNRTQQERVFLHYDPWRK